MQLGLQRPIGVFDAGIGSYGIVELIRRRYPDQDIIYFADRASFPYGSKRQEALRASVLAAISRLADAGAVAVVLASNAPSVMVLDALRPELSLPVLGVYPPVAQALQLSRSRHVAVIGVQSLIDSAEIGAYVASQADGGDVALVNGSPLVARVEDGTFLSDPGGTQRAMDVFMAALRRDLPKVDVCTLSSTHLPWLRRFFEAAAPDMGFLDPAEEIIPQLRPYLTPGRGKTVCIATESASFPLSGLREMFHLLGVDIEPLRV